MKIFISAIMILFLSGYASAGDILVKKTAGIVEVRYGVLEKWVNLHQGESIPLNATIRTGAGGSAVLMTSIVEGDGFKTIRLPSEVILDISDVRHLTQEELMLKLTMERVRASSYEWKSKEMNIPNATVVHGPDRSASQAPELNSSAAGVLRLNGARVLFENGFYSTCALKALEILRSYPGFDSNYEYRWMAAEALENARLPGEALNEYTAISKSGNLTDVQQARLEAKIRQLRGTGY